MTNYASARAGDEFGVRAGPHPDVIPGDVYWFDGPVERTPTWWVVVEADGDQYRLVRADQGRVREQSDVVAPGQSLGTALVVRCGAGVWLPADKFAYAQRDERLPGTVTAAVRGKAGAASGTDAAGARLGRYLDLRTNPVTVTVGVDRSVTRPPVPVHAEAERFQLAAQSLDQSAPDPSPAVHEVLNAPRPAAMVPIETWLPGRLLARRTPDGAALRYEPGEGEPPPVVQSQSRRLEWTRAKGAKAYDLSVIPWADGCVSFAVGPHAALTVVVSR